MLPPVMAKVLPEGLQSPCKDYREHIMTGDWLLCILEGKISKNYKLG